MTIQTHSPSPSTPASNDTNALLGRVLERLEALEAKVDALNAAAEPVPELLTRAQSTLDEVPHLAAMAGDMADAWVRARIEEGMDPDQTLRGLGELLRTLSRPSVLEAAGRLADRLPDLARIAEDAPKMAAMAVDAFDELAQRAAEQGLEVDAVLKSFLTVGIRVTEVLDSPQFKGLLHSDVLAPETLEIVGRAGRALTEQSSQSCGRTGLFGALGAVRDEDIQRALNFAIGFAQRFGAKMNCAVETPTPRIAAGAAAAN